ncbi:asparaginase [Georgenia sp. TF02-10]|uniref:asparaginase n=1 Tax=Georgenia sp. TF02-10 TaxID=2917725 RepID=UPI001FA77470|nr:asparaginase [Georgenia sp. TF02-10]UNX55096.1 asparaginase [Georgenia sp. TF02-10]
MPDPSLAELAAVTRSGLVESRHLGTLVALDADGAVALSLGDPDATVLPRSTVKPFQALACLTAGAPLTGPELAIAAGSHTGEDAHVQVVRTVLERAGLAEDALGCPADWPADEPTRHRLVAAGEGRAAVRMNCSGKHAAMLLTCATNGWDTATYLDPHHPLQQHVRATLAEATGQDVRHDATDGCGAPLFGTTVRGLATGFRRLALAAPGTPARTVADAMRAHPFFVGGTGHPNSQVMDGIPGALAKGGAEGVIGMAGPDGQAVAMKIVDGNSRATTVLALLVLSALGVDVSGAAELLVVPVLGGGRPVGGIVPGRDLAAWLDTRQPGPAR